MKSGNGRALDLECECWGGYASDLKRGQLGLRGAIMRPYCVDLHMSWGTATWDGPCLTQGTTT